MSAPEYEIDLDNDDHPTIILTDMDECYHICLKAAGNDPSCARCKIFMADFCPDPLLDQIRKWKNKLKYISKDECEDIISETISGIAAGIQNFSRRAQFATWAWSIFLHKLNDHWRQKSKVKKIVLTDEIFTSLRSLFPPPPVFTPDNINALENLQNQSFSNPRALRKAIEDAIGPIQHNEFNIIFQYAISAEKELINDQPAQEDIKDMLTTLEELLPLDQSGCIELLLEVYYRQSQGETIISIAETKNMLPNTLTQQIKRCTKKINELLRGQGCL